MLNHGSEDVAALVGMRPPHDLVRKQSMPGRRELTQPGSERIDCMRRTHGIGPLEGAATTLGSTIVGAL
jgi:hypothetical protein